MEGYRTFSPQPSAFSSFDELMTDG